MAQTFTPSPQQQAIFDFVTTRNGGNAIVEAVAGAGKTTTLVKACELMTGSVFIGAYNNKMAKELRERIGHMSNVRSSTFHSAGMNQLRRAITIKGDPDPKKTLNVISAYIQEKGRADLEPLANTVAKMVSMAKQRGIGVCFPDTDQVWIDMAYHFDLTDDLPEGYESRMDQVVAFSRAMLKRGNAAAMNAGLIDFDDMIHLPLLLNLRMFQNDWVLVDEAQDTNPTRRELAKRMLRTGGRLIAVGDPRQAIYGFSGADNDALEQIGAEFKARALPLTVTYRCPKSVVRVAQEWVSHIEAHESAPEGQFHTLHYDDLMAQIKAGDAVLCRFNKYLVSLCFKLIRNGVPARIEGRAIGAGLIALIGKWKTGTTEALQGKINDWREREMKKANDAGKETKALQIEDRAETVMVLIERANEQGITTTAGLKKMIEGLFDDRVVDNKDMVTLCSVHRSKGLEFPTVYVLGLHELMGRECIQPWQTVQENNLQYVAATRAQERLIEVYGVKEEPRKEVA